MLDQTAEKCVLHSGTLVLLISFSGKLSKKNEVVDLLFF